MTIQEIQDKIGSTKYSILYIKIIEKANSENRIKLKKDNPKYKYYEAHHILPKSIFKEYSVFRYNPWNKVLLTAREHFICHILIMKHYRKIGFNYGYIKMSKAITALKMKNTYNSKLYETIKTNLVTLEETKIKISNSLKGRIFSEEHKNNLKLSRQNQIITKETKMKISKTIGDSRQGSNNKNAKTIQIFDSFDVLRFSICGGFKDLCNTKNLPYVPFMNSYKNNGEPIFKSNQAKTKAKNNGFGMFVGWYAIIP